VTILHSITGTLSGIAKGATNKVAGLGLNAISSWVLDGTKAALQQVANMIGAATSPNLQSTWFSSTYWRVAALSALLTVPFLCAAAVQAVVRGDLALLGKAALGYLPLSAIGVSLAAPLTMLLLAATDQMSRVVSATAVNGGAHFLDQAAAAAGTLSVLDGSPFFAVIVGLFAVMAALALALELIVRAAAVYVVVLMLPLAFAALVWPARRIWAARLVELLVSLILSKFVIVAVLSLAAAALAADNSGISQLLTAMALLLLATFSPWALMRLLPFTELAAGAAGMLRQEMPQAHDRAMKHAERALGVGEAAMSLPSRMRQQAADVDGAPIPDTSPTGSAFGSTRSESSGEGSGVGASSDGPSAAEASGGEFTGPVSTSQPAGTGAETGSGAGRGTGRDTTAQSSNGAGRERLPGMDPIWQAQNGEWGEIKHLGPDFVRNGIDYSPPIDHSPPADEPGSEDQA
jgi:hypothetical protein